MAEFDVSATVVTLGSGVVIDQDYVSANGAVRAGDALTDVFSSRPLVNSFDGTTPDTLTIAARTLTGAGVAYGSLTWSGQW